MLVLPSFVWLFSAALALSVPGAVPRSLNLSAQDLDTGLAGASAEGPGAAYAAQNRTFMQCLGTQTMTRACHFQNVYYDLQTSRFVHYGIASAKASTFGDDIESNEPWLRLVRYVPLAAHLSHLMLPLRRSCGTDACLRALLLCGCGFGRGRDCFVVFVYARERIHCSATYVFTEASRWCVERDLCAMCTSPPGPHHTAAHASAR